jgi:hypothetical protein
MPDQTIETPKQVFCRLAQALEQNFYSTNTGED